MHIFEFREKFVNYQENILQRRGCRFEGKNFILYCFSAFWNQLSTKYNVTSLANFHEVGDFSKFLT